MENSKYARYPELTGGNYCSYPVHVVIHLMELTGQFSSVILGLFFLLLNHKLRVGRTLVKRLIEHESSAS